MDDTTRNNLQIAFGLKSDEPAYLETRPYRFKRINGALGGYDR